MVLITHRFGGLMGCQWPDRNGLPGLPPQFLQLYLFLSHRNFRLILVSALTKAVGQFHHPGFVRRNKYRGTTLDTRYYIRCFPFPPDAAVALGCVSYLALKISRRLVPTRLGKFHLLLRRELSSPSSSSHQPTKSDF